MSKRSTIRAYEPADRDALYDVCVRTAYRGGDSRQRVPDLELIPSVFMGPYLALEPDLAFVVDDRSDDTDGDGGGRAVGYIIGTADSPTFFKRFRSEWLPTVTDRYPDLTGPQTTESDLFIDLLHRPEQMMPPEVADYPAHLHICLLPNHQGSGYGRELMYTLFNALQQRGVERVHLGMSKENHRARAFYDRLGFHEIPIAAEGGATYLGRSTRVEPWNP